MDGTGGEGWGGAQSNYDKEGQRKRLREVGGKEINLLIFRHQPIVISFWCP